MIFDYNVNKNSIEYNGKHFAYCNGGQSKIVKKLNELHEENEQLKSELQRIYDVATLKRAWDIVNTVYDDLLYETSEESDYARDKLLECLEMIDKLRDELE